MGLVGGMVANGLIFYWFQELFSHYTALSGSGLRLSSALVTLWQGSLWVVVAWLTPPLLRRFPQGWLVGIPCLMVALEFGIPQLFPYPQGASHYQVTSIFLVVSLVGVHGMTFLLLWSNCLLYEGLRRLAKGRRWPVRHTLVFGAVLGCAWLYSWHRGEQYHQARASAPTLKLGLIQPGLTYKQLKALGKSSVHQLYISLSHDAIGKGAEWVLWPEGAFQQGLLNQFVPSQLLLQEAEQLGVPLLVGGTALASTSSGAWRTNSARHAVFGVGLGKQYDKMRLVPFAEYQPWRGFLAPLYKRIGIKDRIAPGQAMSVHTLQNVRYSFLICYEAIFQDLARLAVNKGARLLVNLVNDRSFGRTTAPHQHLMLAAIRSAELGVPMARVTTTGISTSIDALGRLGPQSTLFQKTAAVHPVALVELPGLYRTLGDAFSWLCVCVVVLMLALLLPLPKPVLDNRPSG